MTTNDPFLASQRPDPSPLPGGPEDTDPLPHDPYAALRNTNYRRYFTGNAFSLVGTQMAGVAIAWELYALTNSATALGLVGLVQIVPIVLLSLPAGHIVDRFNRKKVILLATSLVMLLYIVMGASSRYAANLPSNPLLHSASTALAAMAHTLGEKNVHFADPHVPILFLLLLLIGCLRAVNQPAKQSIMPMLVSPLHFANAVTWSSSLFEVSNMVGPTIAGFAIAAMQGPDLRNSWAYAAIYWTNAAFQLVQLINFSLIKLTHAPRPREPVTLKTLLAGVHFVVQTKIVLGTITLDLFAVLLGGAVALLPVFAKDILHVGPMGLGMLRAAPSVGALSMAMILAHLPPMKHAGRNLLWAVAGFGAATIVFGLSTSFILSLFALAFTGVFDNISVVVRHTLVQLMTPDSMRGRVNAVNSVFISCSNELGAFESGATAALWGPMPAVIVGGIGTIAVVALVTLAWPQIRSVRQLAHHQAEEPQGLPVEPATPQK